MICLKGNHESYLVEFLHNPSVLGDWRHFGGLETLRSYGLDPSTNPDSAEELRLARTLATRFACRAQIAPEQARGVLYLR